MSETKRPYRLDILNSVLGEVYGYERKPTPTTQALAEWLDENWQTLVERESRHGDGFRHELTLTIWNWFSGGDTAHYASGRIVDALAARGSTECICRQPLYEAYSDCPIHGHDAMLGKGSQP